MHSDMRFWAAPGYELEFELWSAGPDGQMSWWRDDRRQPPTTSPARPTIRASERRHDGARASRSIAPQGRVIRLAAAGRASFTLVELATVIGILALLFGLLTSMIGPRTIRGPMVKAAADQLASVLRKTRQMAMDNKGVYGVTFNIQNAPGSSGSVLNNRSGGHWYRIIGPHDPGNSGQQWSGAGCYYIPLFFDRSDWGAGAATIRPPSSVAAMSSSAGG